MRAFLSFHADRWLIRPTGGAPPAFFGIPESLDPREAAHIQLFALIASARAGTMEGAPAFKARWEH